MVRPVCFISACIWIYIVAVFYIYSLLGLEKAGMHWWRMQNCKFVCSAWLQVTCMERSSWLSLKHGVWYCFSCKADAHNGTNPHTRYGPNNISAETGWTKAITKKCHVLHSPFTTKALWEHTDTTSQSYCASGLLLRKHQSTTVMVFECPKDLTGNDYLSENSVLTIFFAFLQVMPEQVAILYVWCVNKRHGGIENLNSLLNRITLCSTNLNTWEKTGAWDRQVQIHLF